MMTWNDLYIIIHEKGMKDRDFLHENVTIYDRTEGEYYPADTIEFLEDDDVLDAGSIFITMDT
tara:strand:+ start:612 stop:800 length:189 start_codon:yes stop_codon:yes gene_type:complete